MEAILLVGGLGTRLLPLTKTVPKPLIPLANVPFVDRTVRWLGEAGIDHIILCLHYNAELFREYFAAHPPAVKLSFAIEEEPLGTGGAIKNCESFLRAPRCLVFNGDIFTTLNLGNMLAAHRRNGAQVSIALTEVEDPSRYGVIETEQTGLIRSFTEKPPRALALSRNVNAGVYIFERTILDCFPDGPCSVERDIFPSLLDQGYPLYGYQEYPYWTDLGTPADYLQAHRDILTRRVSVPVSHREIAPGLWIGERVAIADDALLRPPVMLGDGVHIARNATVGPQVVLGNGVRVEADALLEDSIVWEGATLRAGSFIHGCILGRDAQVTGTVIDCLCEDHGVLHGERKKE